MYSPVDFLILVSKSHKWHSYLDCSHLVWIDILFIWKYKPKNQQHKNLRTTRKFTRLSSSRKACKRLQTREIDFAISCLFQEQLWDELPYRFSYKTVLSSIDFLDDQTLLEKRLLRFSWTTPKLGLDELASGHVHSHIQLEHSSEPAMLLSLTRWSLLQSCSVSKLSKIFDVLVVMRTQYEQSKSVRHTVRMIDTVSLISGFLSFVINFGKAVSSHVILLLVIISANMSGDVD